MRKLTASLFEFSSLASFVGPLAAAAVMAFGPTALAQDSGDSAGECSGGLCGTPNQSGGGGCGCGGGSVLINNSDRGRTYQFADDYDNDGFEDDFDNCPFAANPDQIDTDSDGVGDVCDNCVSAANFDQTDTDSDGVGDSCDDDIDNDTLLNAADNCVDRPNLPQTDSDGDGEGDVCDNDDDNDGVLDSADNCRTVSNPLVDGVQPVLSDTTGCEIDADQDGVFDSVDNCIDAENPDFTQSDIDNDGIGDACDGDVDGDGLENRRDNCFQTPNNEGATAQLDSDRDGSGDVCDDRFCYIIYGPGESAGQASDGSLNFCLDPTVTFKVLSLPVDFGKVGEASHLHLFANRENAAIRYIWTVVERPSGSRARVANPTGSVALSNSWEYRYADGQRAEFTPDVAGNYQLQVSAQLVFPDSLFPTSAGQSTATFTLTAEEGEGGGGCTSTRGDLSLAGLAILALFGFVARRRR